MELKDYCKGVEMELTLWKARLYDVVNHIERLPTGKKQRMYEEINGLHMVMADLDDRVEKLRKECPTQWQPEHEDIRGKFSVLNSRYNDTAGVLFDYDFGG